MTGPVEVLFIGFTLAIIAILFAGFIKSDREDYANRLEDEIEELEIKLNAKREQLIETKDEIEYGHINRMSGLPTATERILNEYDRLSIRIPADIIEELHVTRFRTDEEIRSFIENQRQSWKYECSKKPLKAVK